MISDRCLMPCLAPLQLKERSVPCGKCPYCLSLKRWMYSARIAAECHNSPRTWFVTLTLRRHMSDAVGYKLVQRWLKRLRSRFPASYRYAAIAEHGSQKTMRLHYHVALHGPLTLTERKIRSCWRGGISQATLVRFGAARNVARYSTKLARYVTKGSNTRFRFSQGYGSKAVTAICETPLVKAVLRAFPGSSLRLDGINIPKKMVQCPREAELWALTDEFRREAEETRLSHASEIAWKRLMDRRMNNPKYARQTD